MKLIHYTIGRLVVIVLLMMACWSVFFYFRIMEEVHDETDDSLKNYKKIIIKQVLKDSSFLTHRPDILTRYYIREISKKEGKRYKEHFETTEAFNEYELDDEPVRVLRTAFKTKKNRYYELTIYTSTLEEDDLLESILWAIVYLYVATVAGILIVSVRVFRKSLRPFYRLMNWLDSFTLGASQEPLEEKTRITEFRKLNKAVLEMAERNEVVFQEQKQFIENASHELQTPLAICRNRLQLLAENSDRYTGEQMKDIGEIYEAVGRLTRLNKALLLLSRIGNRQYADVADVEFNVLLKELTEDFKEIYAYRKVEIELEERGRFRYRMNEMLSRILVTNLVKNAVSHSPEGTTVKIGVFSDEILFTNSAKTAMPLDKDRIFRRFYHADADNSESSGLGLAIVKSITDLYGLEIEYIFDGKHHFKLRKDADGRLA